MAARRGSASDTTSVRLPARAVGPISAITRRLGAALLILLVVVAVVLLDRDGYRDVTGDRIGVIDAFYYATVTLSTTGYGDIVPVSDAARLVNILIVTPARVLFLIILVGTTLAVLTERSREQFRIRNWRSRVREHVVVCGYGTKGRSAVDALLEDGTPIEQIVVVERDAHAAKEATTRGLAVVPGSSSRAGVLREAEIETARAVVVATDADDAAVLTVLTARDLAPRAWIVAAVRETENIPLVRQSGADQVVVSSATAGRLLGLSTSAPQLVTVVEDLLTASAGLALTVRPVARDEVGRSPSDLDQPVAAVVRDGRLHNFGHPSVQRLDPGDRVVCIADVDGRPVRGDAPAPAGPPVRGDAPAPPGPPVRGDAPGPPVRGDAPDTPVHSDAPDPLAPSGRGDAADPPVHGDAPDPAGAATPADAPDPAGAADPPGATRTPGSGDPAGRHRTPGETGDAAGSGPAEASRDEPK